jgi:hypothetical protein
MGSGSRAGTDCCSADVVGGAPIGGFPLFPSWFFFPQPAIQKAHPATTRLARVTNRLELVNINLPWFEWFDPIGNSQF